MQVVELVEVVVEPVLQRESGVPGLTRDVCTRIGTALTGNAVCASIQARVTLIADRTNITAVLPASRNLIARRLSGRPGDRV